MTGEDKPEGSRVYLDRGLERGCDTYDVVFGSKAALNCEADITEGLCHTSTLPMAFPAATVRDRGPGIISGPASRGTSTVM